LREAVRVDLVGQLGHHQADAVLDLLDLDHRAHDDRASTGAVGVLDALAAQDERPGGKVWALDLGHHVGEELLARSLRVQQEPLDAGGDFAQVVRRNLGGHADRNTRRAVDQKVREPARQHRRFLGLAVVVVLEVDRVLVDVADHLHRQCRHPALGVSRRGRRVVTR
jgi:hypothetical protein